MRWVILFLTIGLGACTAGGAVITRADAWTGAVTSYTPEYEIFRDRNAIMVVRPVIVTMDGARAYGLLTSIRRKAPNGPLIRAVYSGNIKLQYQRHDRLLTHCIDGCQRAEIGVITLTETAFHTAAQTGLPVRVQGRRGRYSGVAPAWLFQQVLAAQHTP